MLKKQKLELTWIGKGESPNLEPRILIEDPSLSYGDKHSENMLIHGDNLLALKALEQDFAGKIKCIYIDPPYNTGNAFEHYDDGLEHSIWLGLMYERLKILSRLLAPNGVILVQIDKEESAYLKVIMDEIFGRNNYITTICVRMSATSGYKIEHSDKTIVKNAEYLHVYSKALEIKPAYEKASYDSHYSYILNKNMIIENLTDIDFVKKELNRFELPLSSKSLVKLFDLSNDFKGFVTKNMEKIGRTHTAPAEALKNKDGIMRQLATDRHVIKYTTKSGEQYLIKKTDSSLNQYIPISLKFNYVDDYDGYNKRLSNILGDWWDGFYLDMGNVENEGGVYFKASKKAERLIFRILNMFTGVGDIILDSFLGSGTTAAVAHKIGRRWIGIELGEHCYTHCVPRLKKVVDGTDLGGISKAVNWEGGGGFKFYELAPSLLNKDKYGNWLIAKEYRPEMLAAAMAKHEGFRFQPDPELFWKQGFSTEKDFIFTTTNHISVEYLERINQEMKKDESILICCKSFDRACENRYPNMTLKKIPKMLLGRCEFGKEDYSLNIINMSAEEDEDELMTANELRENCREYYWQEIQKDEKLKTKKEN